MALSSKRAFAGRFAFSIRAKLAIVALVLLVIPWVGYNYVKTIERLLRENQVQAVVANARAVATALQDRPRLIELRASETTGTSEDPPRAASDEIKFLVTGLARAGSRIWIVDRRLQLVATAGNLDQPAAVPNEDLAFGPLEHAVRAVLRTVFERVQRPSTAVTEEIIPNDVVFGGREIERPLYGTASWRWRAA